MISQNILWYHDFCDIKMDFLISKKKAIKQYHKIEFVISKNHNEFLISQNFCDITNPILWYHKIDFVISQNHFDFLYKKLILWYQKIDLWYHKARFIFDFTKSNLWYQKMILWYHLITMILWYQKVYFVISQNNFFLSVLWKNDSSRK